MTQLELFAGIGGFGLAGLYETYLDAFGLLCK